MKHGRNLTNEGTSAVVAPSVLSKRESYNADSCFIHVSKLVDEFLMCFYYNYDDDKQNSAHCWPPGKTTFCVYITSSIGVCARVCSASAPCLLVTESVM